MGEKVYNMNFWQISYFLQFLLAIFSILGVFAAYTAGFSIIMGGSFLSLVDSRFASSAFFPIFTSMFMIILILKLIILLMAFHDTVIPQPLKKGRNVKSDDAFNLRMKVFNFLALLFLSLSIIATIFFILSFVLRPAEALTLIFLMVFLTFLCGFVVAGANIDESAFRERGTWVTIFSLTSYIWNPQKFILLRFAPTSISIFFLVFFYGLGAARAQTLFNSVPLCFVTSSGSIQAPLLAESQHGIFVGLKREVDEREEANETEERRFVFIARDKLVFIAPVCDVLD